MSFIRKYKKGKYTYLAEVKSYRKHGKIKQKFIRYIGREVDGETVLSGSINRAEITKVSVFGPLLVLHEIADQINLRSLLGDYGEVILAMVYAHCLQPKSLNKLQHWFSKTDLNYILNLEKVTEKILLSALDSLNVEKSKYLQDKIFENVKQNFELENKGVVYDVTNTYFHGNKCLIAKRGHNKEKRNKPQIQIGLAVTKPEAIPLFHKVFDGNIGDSRTLTDVLNNLKENEFEDNIIVWDKGSQSQNNVKTAKELGFEVICGLALNNRLKKDVDKIYSNKKFDSFKNRIKLQNSILYVEKKEYLLQEKKSESKGNIYICLNKTKKETLRERRYTKIEEALQQLEKNKEIDEELKKYFHQNNEVNEKQIEQAEKYGGLSVIFSTKNLTKKEVVKIYFGKDLVEKAFRTLKGITQIRPVRHWLEERVKAHIFICYLSYLLLSLLQLKLKKTEFNAINALEELDTMYKVHIKDPKTKNTFTKTVALTKKQEDILKAVNKNLLKECSDQKTLQT
ncbi:MAG: IS1634 family transposase [Candidatus Micrarchaeota archaeon]